MCQFMFQHNNFDFHWVIIDRSMFCDLTCASVCFRVPVTEHLSNGEEFTKSNLIFASKYYLSGEEVNVNLQTNLTQQRKLSYI